MAISERMIVKQTLMILVLLTIMVSCKPQCEDVRTTNLTLYEANMIHAKLSKGIGLASVGKYRLRYPNPLGNVREIDFMPKKEYIAEWELVCDSYVVAYLDISKQRKTLKDVILPIDGIDYFVSINNLNRITDGVVKNQDDIYDFLQRAIKIGNKDYAIKYPENWENIKKDVAVPSQRPDTAKNAEKRHKY